MRRARLEQTFQRMVVDGLRAALPRTWLIAHYPAGGYRTQAEAGIFKAMGVLPGFPDIMVLGEASWGAGAWFLELKAGTAGPTEVQQACHDKLRGLGFGVEVVRSWAEVLVVARQWHWPVRIVDFNSGGTDGGQN